MSDRPIALVTGAARGIGRACAEILAEAGHRLVIVDVDAEGAEEAAASIGGGAFAHVCDMGEPVEVDALFDRVEEEAGPVSVLVNNAGVALPADFLDYSVDDFRRVLDINLVGPFLATQRAARAMVAHGIEGAIVNISSINAEVAIPSIPAYCASKGGIRQLTKAAALALAPYNIRVNAVGPGSIDTAMLAGINANPEAMEVVLSRTPLRRLGTAREIAEVVAFLASPKASYITGETIYADGGRLALNYTV
ncbi:NAD(P)-dependent dehydrogenase, short-chain alcohol dehydrogenase family [Meinhardsimonia xiamenensis]|jgi:NAD(P)-dependent dehydrogenase (short-subunit alcohol dehydrogenase family)|uniref:NAD(P)-dependent dehydrogenase, short-chain alcohol dehydrogenase family n=1 Tax=Meinhardsimonia xiamenensis TaxID=990712 RepID=A0A1G9F3K4_9RHOB|nr:SDR family oxidoreductase [Meinhardsimonia xiamenensis]PRX38009.1 NAD(P)-dependent dehydrogenase (short-subunit alcohol dehydrogenase family) [Meinhardsimonia xiamenensis]SDK83039.1 NAD(P)-dependent dehydrogenase, short-chain alcohol dehydrogenase family [Meinhardsimonia xiamenensis]